MARPPVPEPAPAAPRAAPSPRHLPFSLLLALLLAVLPPLRILWIVSTTGADTPSNDYIFTIDLIDRVLSGSYDWRGYFHDTFIQGAHCMALPVLARLALVRLTAWNLYAELYLTVALFALRLLLLADLLTLRTRPRDALWLWPLLSGLVFSVAQVDVFGYGDAGLQIGLVQLGVTLGLWGLMRFPGEGRGVALASFGGLAATWSGGGGLLAWPVLLLGMFLCGFRRPVPYLGLLTVGALAVLPYAAELLGPSAGGARPETGLHFPTPARLLASAGYPVTPGMGGDQNPSLRTTAAGCAGMGLLLAGAWLVAGRGPRGLGGAGVPAGLLLAWGLLNILAAAVLRPVLASWYTTAFLGFWIGLLGLANAVWSRRDDLPARGRLGGPKVAAAWSAAAAGGIALLLLASNVTYTDKVTYLLPSRGPAAAAAVRHYATAPTYAEELAFLGFGFRRPPYLARLARPLEKHRLSLFRARQEWSLQGEYFLDTVTTRGGETDSAPYWSPDRGATRGSWRDYRHLDLVLPPGASLLWSVQLPAAPARAVLRTAVLTPAGGGGVARIEVAAPGEREALLLNTPFGAESGGSRELPLEPWVGRRITLRFMAAGGPVVFRYPAIGLDGVRAEPSGEQPVRPANVDPPGLPQTDGFVFDLARAGAWASRRGVLGEAGPAGERAMAPGDYLQWLPEVDLPLSGFDRLAVTVAAPAGGANELTAMRALLRVRRPDGAETVVRPALVLRPDGRFHTYTYPLRLLELETGTRLRGLRLHPTNGGELRVRGIRLVRRMEG